MTWKLYLYLEALIMFFNYLLIAHLIKQVPESNFKIANKLLKEISEPIDERSQWISALLRVSLPVLSSMSNGTLLSQLTKISNKSVKTATFEALARTLNGISPFLELPTDSTNESKIRDHLLLLAHKSLTEAVSLNSSDTIRKANTNQRLVEYAFLSQAFLRSPKRLWGGLGKETQQTWISLMIESRKITPCTNNWLLFAGEVEVFLYTVTGEFNSHRLYLGTNMFIDKYYKGGGVYGDGVDFAFDYYNSFVIHPMLLDILTLQAKLNDSVEKVLNQQKERSMIYSEWLERLVMEDGSYPSFGRSSCYRMGAFHQLAYSALRKDVLKHTPPAQIRCALSAVINKQVNDRNFTPEGFLTLGFNGEQEDMCDYYINGGSLYLCSFIFLPLGLPPEDQFWTDPPTPWSGKRAWNGMPYYTH